MFLLLCMRYSCKCVRMLVFHYCLASLVGFVLVFGIGRFRVRWGPFLFWFYVVSLLFLLFFVVVVFFWKVLGEARPEGPLRLTLNFPAFFSLFVFFCFCYFLWRVQGQVRWGHLT